MTDHYAVFGNPIGHSKSPIIHSAFARQTGQDIGYTAILAPLDGFGRAVDAFIAAGGRGANVTVPFKQQAYQRVTRLTARAELAGAVNTLVFDGGAIIGDNTDGCGLLRDITINLKWPVGGRRVLLLGAGGAARGVVGPLLEARPESLTIANRTVATAKAVSERFAARGPVTACGYDQLAGQFDLVIDATSASLGSSLPPLPPGLFAPASLAYTMMYGQRDSPFMTFARAQGAAQIADGLGMLVEQAAESFFLWRGVRPDVLAVIALLRHA
jgi:shikimate dehydrogenase